MIPTLLTSMTTIDHQLLTVPVQHAPSTGEKRCLSALKEVHEAAVEIINSQEADKDANIIAFLRRVALLAKDKGNNVKLGEALSEVVKQSVLSVDYGGYGL
jgi:hypothetical protein